MKWLEFSICLLRKTPKNPEIPESYNLVAMPATLIYLHSE